VIAACLWIETVSVCTGVYNSSVFDCLWTDISCVLRCGIVVSVELMCRRYMSSFRSALRCSIHSLKIPIPARSYTPEMHTKPF